MAKITVLLVDDHEMVREGLRALLEEEGSFEIVGEAANGLEAIEMYSQFHPSVIVIDIAMPKLNGLEAIRRMKQQFEPPPKILVLSAHSDDMYVEQATLLGVMGYLVKQSSANILAKAIKEINKGKPFYSLSIVKQRNARISGGTGLSGQSVKNERKLTSREREVLQLVAEGNANKEVADELSISIKTVEKHRQSVMNKLNIHDTAGLTRYAISAGIIEHSVQRTTI